MKIQNHIIIYGINFIESNFLFFFKCKIINVFHCICPYYHVLCNKRKYSITSSNNKKGHFTENNLAMVIIVLMYSYHFFNKYFHIWNNYKYYYFIIIISKGFLDISRLEIYVTQIIIIFFKKLKSSFYIAETLELLI